MSDLYSLLGTAKTASQAALGKAYRSLARQWHPDANGGDIAVAEKFKSLSGAYAILGNPERRAAYDRGEIDAQGRPRRRARPRPASPRRRKRGEDIFSEFFRGRSNGRREKEVSKPGSDVAHEMRVSFLEAARGGRKKLPLTGGGKIAFTVPAGVSEGQHIRLKGKGKAGSGGAPAGDLLVSITVEPHKYFRRQGRDILLDLPVTLPEAVLGAKIRVPTLAGTVTVTIPRGANNGSVLRLSGRGIGKAGGGRGDQLISLRLVLPRQPDKALERLVERWSRNTPYEAGRDFD